jgi:ATP-dependent DNA ligase
MTWRYPDKPKHTLSRAALVAGMFAEGDFLAEAKADGWRCLIEVAPQGVTYTSRENKPLPVSIDVREPLEAALFEALRPFVKHGTLLDAEWIARRPGARDTACGEQLVIFDLLRIGEGEYFGESVRGRWQGLQALAPLAPWIVPATFGDYLGTFDRWQQEIPWAEGIVLKRLDSHYIGSARECALNPGWSRVKWRAGEDGCTPV